MKYIIFISVSLLYFGSYSQETVILKKKEVQIKLDNISKLVDEKKYENAFDIFYSQSEVITSENVSKKSRDNYESIKTILKDKREEFNANQEIVDKFQKKYKRNEYCSGFEVLDVSLNSEIAYKKSISTLNKIQKSYSRFKEDCSNNKSNVENWVKKFDNNEYESMFEILDISYTQKYFYYPEDKDKLEDLQNKINPFYKEYSEYSFSKLTSPLSVVKSIDYEKLEYDQCLILIKDLKDAQKLAKEEILILTWTHPILDKDYMNFEESISIEIDKLEKWESDNRPLTNVQISNHVFTKAPIDLNFISNNISEATYEIYSIYNLDVFRYFNLYDYNSDLEKAVYKSSEEYKRQLKELKLKKNDLLRTTYFIHEEELFDSDYDIKKKGFYILIRSNYGFGTVSAQAPKSFGSPSSSFQLKTLPSKNIPLSYEIFGKGIMDEKLFLQMAPEIGLKIERNKKDVDVYFLFVPKGKETVKYQHNNMSHGWFEMTEEVITINRVRIIVINKVDESVYFDKIY